MKPDDAELDQLLGRGRLSGREYDDIEARVMQRVAPARRRWSWPVLVPSAAGFALAAFLIVAGGAFERQPEEEGFRPKGGPGVSHPDTASRPLIVDAGCGGVTARTCHLGETLMISLSGASGGHVSAYAERVGEGEPSRIWYFPTPSSSVQVRSEAGTTVLPQGIQLGPPHAPGEYLVTILLSPTPLSRGQLRGPDLRVGTVLLKVLP
jgi:hypothetical protein